MCVKICRFPPSVFAVRRREKAAGIIALFQGVFASYGGKKTGAKWQIFAHTSMYTSYFGAEALRFQPRC